jgi:hypothetical protein
MESLVIDGVIEAANDVDSTQDAVKELSANDLMLVGGGTANVCWL